MAIQCRKVSHLDRKAPRGMFHLGRLYRNKAPPGFKTRMHSASHLSHHARYFSSARSSSVLRPYSLPRLNGGSANTVSTEASRSLGRTFMQSSANRIPPEPIQYGGVSDPGFRMSVWRKVRLTLSPMIGANSGKRATWFIRGGASKSTRTRAESNEPLADQQRSVAVGGRAKHIIAAGITVVGGLAAKGWEVALLHRDSTLGRRDARQHSDPSSWRWRRPGESNSTRAGIRRPCR